MAEEPRERTAGCADAKDLHVDVRAAILKRLAGRGTHGRYRIDGEIARGAQGVILSAWDEDLHRKLAMKVILRAQAGDEKGEGSRTLGRFLEEAQITGQLDHPGIVPVHELGLDSEGRLYFTMRLVRGRDLREIFELAHTGREGWNLARALGVLLKVCEAVAYAHRKGVIHRDLKPGNIMVGRFGEVYVMDWGLARVLGHPDGHDLRVREELHAISLVESDLRSHSTSGEMLTVDGTAVGTPAYMAPEQARGESTELDARADVYSAGAMLYHLLTGQVPFVPPGARMTAQQVLWRAVEGPPTPVHELAPAVPFELVAICEKAMARIPQRRYRDMEELREDLAAFLEHRVVAAYASGALVELQKWVARNRALATASAALVLAVIGGLVLALFLQRESERHAVLAAQRGAVAERRGDELLRLSAFQRLEDLERDADRLWPILPSLAPEYRAWLQRAALLGAELEPDAERGYPGHRAKLAELTALGRTATHAEREEELRRHPRFGELERERERLEHLRAVLAAREALAPAAELGAGLPEDAAALLELAWPAVDPERTLFGHEAHGLAQARRALEHVHDDVGFARASEVLAWALFACGHDEDAAAELGTALEIVPSELAGELSSARVRLAAERRRLGSPHTLERLTASVADLEAKLLGPQHLRFDDEDHRWWHWQLSKLVQAIEAFVDPETGLVAGRSSAHGLGVARRLELADEIDSRTLRSTEAQELWRAAASSIADRNECPRYDGLVLAPQAGLLPLGRDPRSGLFEFAHLLSGEPPVRSDDGRLVIGPESSLVLVLLPGGTFWMGAQSFAPSAPNFDPLAQPGEGPVHRVRISPFFISKYEMTQGQWLRFTGENPSRDTPESWDLTWSAARKPCNLAHPVESVEWDLCTKTLARMGLALPSEAQWEYGARGGTTTVRWTGDPRETLAGAANVCDRYAHENGGASWGYHDEWLDDGFTSHAPVGTFAPNAFGLHEVLGNVWEWCLDGYLTDFYARSPQIDPLCDPSDSPVRIARGGGIYNHSDLARSAMRYNTTPGLRDGELGLRPARTLER